MKALWVTPSFFPRVGGLELYVESVVSSLAELLDLGLVTKADQWFPSEVPITHFTVAETQPRNFGGRWKTAEEIADIVYQFSPDIVHLGGAEVATHRWALPDSIPVVATVHGNDLTLAGSVASDPGHPARIVGGLNDCQHVFAVSRHTANLCRQWGVTAPMSVVTAGCDTNSFYPWTAIGEQARLDFGLPRDVPILLTVSRLAARKGHLCVLRAIERLPFRVHWVVVGDGPCRKELIEEVARSGMASSVSFWGIVSDHDLPGLYNACDVFVFTPEERRFEDGRIDSEGFGLVFLEASACGKPVIASRVSGCKDAVIEGATGLLVPPADPLRLSMAIDFLVKNPASARELGLGGLMFVQASGGWQRLARQIVAKYEDLLSPRTSPTEPPPLRMPFFY